MRSSLFSTLCRVVLLLGAVSLAGCKGAIGLVSPYEIEVRQGNEVTEDMVAKLKVGMTPAQVRFLLSTPLLADPFHADRWDYIYRLSKGGDIETTKRLTLWFADGKLARWEGNALPAQRPVDVVPASTK